MYRIMSLNNFDSRSLLTGSPTGLAPVYVLIPQSGNLVVTRLLRMRRGVLPYAMRAPVVPRGTTLVHAAPR